MAQPCRGGHGTSAAAMDDTISVGDLGGILGALQHTRCTRGAQPNENEP